jgi:hypothetical protein
MICHSSDAKEEPMKPMLCLPLVGCPTILLVWCWGEKGESYTSNTTPVKMVHRVPTLSQPARKVAMGETRKAKCPVVSSHGEERQIEGKMVAHR